MSDTIDTNGDSDQPVYPGPGERKRLRMSAGLTQRQLAAKLGVTQVTITHYEGGLREPKGRFRYRYFAMLAALQGGG
jgi:DNA-binding XRE family transcriptional regulator